MTSDLTMPAYLQLLRQAWAACDMPSSRALAGDLGFSHSTIHGALTGRSVPNRKLLRLLAEALTLEHAERDLIIEAYDAFRGPEHPEMKTRPPRDAEMIAAAIREGLHEIAEAIRGINP